MYGDCTHTVPKTIWRHLSLCSMFSDPTRDGVPIRSVALNYSRDTGPYLWC